MTDKTSKSSKKRGLNSIGTDSQSQSNESKDVSRSKKTRIHHNYEPVVTDLFQEEAIREVAPSKGLVKESVKPGEKLILGHKVSDNFQFCLILMVYVINKICRYVIKSLFLQIIRMFLYLNTYRQKSHRELIPSN